MRLIHNVTGILTSVLITGDLTQSSPVSTTAETKMGRERDRSRHAAADRDQPDRVSTPSWSPDGKLIAFSSQRDGNMDVYVAEVTGKNQKENDDVDSLPQKSRRLFCRQAVLLTLGCVGFLPHTGSLRNFEK